MMELHVSARGQVQCIYGEEIDLGSIGSMAIIRASYVEPDGQGYWWADVGPIGGPKLGPFERRSDALEAEREWLVQHLGEGAGSSDELMART